MRVGFLTSFLAATLLLPGCASITTEPLPAGLTNQPPAERADLVSQLTRFSDWQLQGKLAVRQPEDSATAVINQWRQRGEHYQLVLSSAFLGMGRTELEGIPGFLELTMPDGETYRSSQPQQLIEAATGWTFPVNALVWWVRGLAVPGEDARLLFNKDRRLAVLNQAGWEIRYDAWHPFVDGQPHLPSRITALKGEKRLRLVITGWQSRNES
ncbi:outer membrane lipoprotein LolB [Tamilnaduibacter salinus]|uniref:Outer-membrane lipoprotein LolB n=1 Tax=Tamilnaduibacter salinus TaxID=1484056 RepID=A0A2U1D0K2_9GAMM|nr:lipoprotein insertase outer membrane protein LolB [Tamilnaduibacter salinus]PVY78922.1 outer membrane lipoprotein LolB [Tamilnaduibacter salinus]